MGNNKFNENTRVQVPAALHLCKLGYTYLDNICAYDTKTNILIDVFLNAVKRLNPGLSGSEATFTNQAIQGFFANPEQSIGFGNSDIVFGFRYLLHNLIQFLHPQFLVLVSFPSNFGASWRTIPRFNGLRLEQFSADLAFAYYLELCCWHICL